MALDTPTNGELLERLDRELGAKSALAGFARVLYAAGDPDDLSALDPGTLARLVERAFALLAQRERSSPKIHIESIATAAGTLSAIEIANDDMPFLVDSVMGELQARSLSPELVLHPIFKVQRSRAGKLEAILGSGDHNWADGEQESFILILLPPLTASVADDLSQALATTLADVRAAVADWQPMLARLMAASDALRSRPPPQIAPALVDEAVAFCHWLRAGQFTFLGMREYRLDGDDASGTLVPIDGTSLGVLRKPGLDVLTRRAEPLAMTPEIRSYFFSPEPLILTKSSIVSHVHRRALMDYIGLKTYSGNGAHAGELRIVGLFTSQAYTQQPQQIPLLRRKVATVVANSGFAPGSHAAKALLNVLDTFPRDELFRIGERLLETWAHGILELELRPRVRVFVRPDRFDRFVSALVYIQRDRYSSATRERIGAILAEAYDGHISAFTPFFTEGPLVRVHFIIERNPGPRPAVEERDLERRINAATRTWTEQLSAALAEAGPETNGLGAKYARAFPPDYADTFTPARAVEDITRIERLGPDGQVGIDFYREDGAPASQVRAAVYRFGLPIPLSDRVPVLENLGFSVIDERSYRITPHFAQGPREVALHDMLLETAGGGPIDTLEHDRRMEEGFLAVFRGDTDNDAFNRLIVAAGADWREVALIRAYAAYLRQIRAPFGQRYIADTLFRHAGVARDLLELFHLRLDPDFRLDTDARKSKPDAIQRRIEGALARVESLDEDRILRRLLNLVLATVRTNFFQRDGEGRPPDTVAFKLASRKVDELPEPRPFHEIWICSPRLEAIHMRFAPIARGGIRWSDRAQDFRTEVLGLCKAQQVKNTVIVPSGAKGGFVPKRLPRPLQREAVMAEGIATYRIFISTLLSLTDNIESGSVVPPERVIRHDADDPYLVVAADKGTATFSDFANEIALERGFWLGDAFASGGSAGYDHKKMGITARGAWECVKRHFREMGIDIQTTPFKVVGIGDMSGDVFGNGMLLSRTIKLVAAFDHRDIFIDPRPEPAASFAERKRLFALPRSSWQDYDKAKISSGGGVFSRAAKSILLSPEMRELLDVAVESMTPAQLINAVLKCAADLLWFGGIGTFIRAAAETDEQVGDRANDGLRITAQDIRAKVIGEGANLALTQRGRIEAAGRGVRINTDFIDNSAGVNTSDQEVNIKIALGAAVSAGKLDLETRNTLLAAMTSDVAAACLRNNYQQSLALSLAERSSSRDIGYLARLAHVLESRGLIDRKLEVLPTVSEFATRQPSGYGLTRPELAVLLSWAKIALDTDLLASTLPDDAACEPLLVEYFPSALRQRILPEIHAHRLRREIIATHITNSMINRGGPAMVVRLGDETGGAPHEIAYAFMAARSVFGLPDLWGDIDALDGKITGALQLELYARVQDFLLEQTAGMLGRHGGRTLSSLVAAYRSGTEALAQIALEVTTGDQQARSAEQRNQLTAGGVPPDVASRIAALDVLGQAPAIAELVQDVGRPLQDVARVVFAAAAYFRLGTLKARVRSLKTSDYYDRLAVNSAFSALEMASRASARRALASGAVDFAAWVSSNGGRLGKAKSLLDEISGAGELTVARLTVAAGQVRDLTAA